MRSGGAMRRREFIKVVGGSAAIWPLSALAQQGERPKRIAILTAGAANDRDYQNWTAAFVQGLQELGWVDGRNVRIDTRWGAGNAADIRRFAAELVALAPDVILSSGVALGTLQQATRTIPIVFVLSADPVGNGYIDSLARPGGNTTGFMLFEYSLSGKWLEILKQIAPGVTRAAVIRDTVGPAGIGQWASLQSLAPSLGVQVSPLNVRDDKEIESNIVTFARGSNGGLIVTASPLTTAHRDLVIKLAAQYKLPAVYWERRFVTNGGLISYGPDVADQFRRAAGYVDRILKGEKPADMPVQAPTKYEIVINLKTARVLGLTVPSSVLARANEVIE